MHLWLSESALQLSYWTVLMETTESTNSTRLCTFFSPVAPDMSLNFTIRITYILSQKCPNSTLYCKQHEMWSQIIFNKKHENPFTWVWWNWVICTVLCLQFNNYWWCSLKINLADLLCQVKPWYARINNCSTVVCIIHS